MTDNEIAQIISQHSKFAPERANVIFAHNSDGRIFYGEKFEQGCQFWDAHTMLPRTLQGIIHSCSLVAKRSDSGNWVSVNDLGGLVGKKRSTPPTYVSEKMSKATKRPSPTPKQQEVKVELIPAVAANPVPSVQDSDWRSEFVGIKELEESRSPRNFPVFISIRKDGKIILSKTLLEKVDNGFDILVSKDFKRLALTLGGEMYFKNKSGNYSHKSLPNHITFPETSGTVRVYMTWDESKNAFFGDL